MFSLPEILLLIGMQERTGELHLESGNNIGTILFHHGKILHASSPYSRAIGDILVDDGLITEADLMETLMLQKKNPNMPLGSLLLKTGKVTFEIIEMMVHEQIRHAMKEFQTWEGVDFSFIDKEIKPFDRISLFAHEFVGSELMQAIEKFLVPHRQRSGTSLHPAAQPIDPSV